MIQIDNVSVRLYGDLIRFSVADDGENMVFSDDLTPAEAIEIAEWIIASCNRMIERLLVIDADEEEIETAYLPRCKECGYTAEDEAIHMDHHLCRGKIPST